MKKENFEWNSYNSINDFIDYMDSPKYKCLVYSDINEFKESLTKFVNHNNENIKLKEFKKLMPLNLSYNADIQKYLLKNSYEFGDVFIMPGSLNRDILELEKERLLSFFNEKASHLIDVSFLFTIPFNYIKEFLNHDKPSKNLISACLKHPEFFTIYLHTPNISKEEKENTVLDIYNNITKKYDKEIILRRYIENYNKYNKFNHFFDTLVKDYLKSEIKNHNSPNEINLLNNILTFSLPIEEVSPQEKIKLEYILSLIENNINDFHSLMDYKINVKLSNNSKVLINILQKSIFVYSSDKIYEKIFKEKKLNNYALKDVVLNNLNYKINQNICDFMVSKIIHGDNILKTTLQNLSQIICSQENIFLDSSKEYEFIFFTKKYLINDINLAESIFLKQLSQNRFLNLIKQFNLEENLKDFPMLKKLHDYMLVDSYLSEKKTSKKIKI